MSSSVATNSPAQTQDTNAAAASGASPSNPNVLSTDINTSSSLYVGDLLSTVTEAILFEIFNPVAPVTNIKVCRDSSTRVSLGYAYVNFQTHADAERVMETMNYIPIKGKPCRISWPIRDANVRKNTAGNVFIKNLDPTIDDRALYDTFSLFGRILSCKVVKDDKGESKGYGFVHFESPQAAESAIEKINGMLISGREVYVGHFMKHEERTQNSQFTNIYVKNVPLHWDDKRFSDLFSECGEIKSVSLSKGGDNKSKGFGFIDFAAHESALKAIEKFNEFEVKTKEGEEKSGAADKSDVIPSADQPKLTQKLVVCRAQKKNERVRELQVKFEQAKKEMIAKYQGVNLFVKDLHESVDDAELREMFKEFGSITSAKVMRDDPTPGENGETQGKSRGFGFVCFTTPEEATKAVTEMNGKEMKGKKIFVALAQRKEIRQAMLLAQNAGRGALNMGMAPQGMFPGAQMFFPNQGRGANPAFPYMQQPMLARGMMNNVAMMQGRGMMPMQGRGQPGFGMQQGFGMQGGMGRVQMQNGPRGPRGGPRTGGNFGGPNQGRGNMRGGQPMMQGGQPMMMQGRGMPQPMMMGMAPQQQQQQIQQPIPVAPLTAAALANASDEEQKNMIGERLFPLVSEISPEFAGKITGMLLEMENPELLHLLESPASLRAKVDEAIKILQTHTQ